MRYALAILIVGCLSGCKSNDPNMTLAKFAASDVKAAAIAAESANDGPALACFKPMADALADGATPGAATLIEANRLCKGLLPIP